MATPRSYDRQPPARHGGTEENKMEDTTSERTDEQIGAETAKFLAGFRGENASRQRASASPSTILAIEKYGYQPQPDTKVLIAHALGVPAEAIWPAAAMAAGVQEPRDG